MKIKYTILFFLVSAFVKVNAQNVLKGTVKESGSNTRLSNVFIRDINSKQLGLTDEKGDFVIKVAAGHTLIFNSPGYTSDTLYVVDMSPKEVKLETQRISLREVNISASRKAFDPRAEYPEVYEKSKLYVLSPTTWFGKDATDARRLKKYFKHEQEERRIDEVFNTTYVGSLVPLKGTQLEDFMTLYRPDYSLVTNNSSQTLAVYINDSYKKYLALPPDKRTVQRLVSQ